MSVSDSDNADLFDGFGNGSHHLWVVCDPDWRPYDAGNAWYLELDFHSRDWNALFKDELHCPDYDSNETRERNYEIFRQSLPNYPMLGRIWDNYMDYRFTPEQIVMLRSECLKLKAGVCDMEVLKALRKLIYACGEASRTGCSLIFVCD
ncbi:MAG: hypothetical protein M3430_13280 [Acidobacteriota bacterium]|nr:hypothetical protein [Acidobacteriota bacterium]